MNNFIENNLQYFIEAGIIILITLILNKIVARIIKKVLKNNKHKDLTTVLVFFKKIIRYLILISGFLIALTSFPIFSTWSITILSGIGVIAAVVGLALKESLGNSISSFELIFNKPFSVGDFINLPEKNISGTVEEISLRHTIINSINNKREIIPNVLLNQLIIENSNFKNDEIVLFEEYSISYDSDIEKAIEIIKEELIDICKITFSKNNKDVEFPKVRVVKWGDSSIKLRAYVWGKNQSEAYENFFELNKRLKVRFDKEKIEIPYKYVNVIQKDVNKE